MRIGGWAHTSLAVFKRIRTYKNKFDTTLYPLLWACDMYDWITVVNLLQYNKLLVVVVVVAASAATVVVNISSNTDDIGSFVAKKSRNALCEKLADVALQAPGI